MGIELKVGQWVMLRDGTGPYEVKTTESPFQINGIAYKSDGLVFADPCSLDVVSVVDLSKKFRLGKEYKLRGGGIGVVLVDDLDNIFRLAGYIETAQGKQSASWLPSGRWDSEKFDHVYDLMPE